MGVCTEIPEHGVGPVHLELQAQGPRCLNHKYLEKAHCCLREDRQKEWVDFDLESLHALVAAHESIRMLIAHAAANNLVLEVADIPNAYRFGRLVVPTIMEQPSDSSGKP